MSPIPARHKSIDGGLCVSKAAFRRVVREICSDDLLKKDIRWQSAAILAAQEGAEAYICHRYLSQ